MQLWYNKKNLLFVSGSWHKFLKPLESTLFYTLRQFMAGSGGRGCEIASGWCLVPRRTDHLINVIRGLKLSAPPPDL